MFTQAVRSRTAGSFVTFPVEGRVIFDSLDDFTVNDLVNLFWCNK
jgi:hypothetical protein